MDLYKFVAPEKGYEVTTVQSGREALNAKPFIPINCAAISESELFGYEKGAFTRANKTRKGLFEIASKGTLFLDEIGEASLSTQAKLLRVLETGEYIPVGGENVRRTDSRIIAA